MLELAILGLLKERPMHGYDLRRRLREDFGPLANLSFGSLYPALARLEAAGAVRVPGSDGGDGAASGPAIPPTGSLAGERAAYRARHGQHAGASRAMDRPAKMPRGPRGRKVYEITRLGEAEFERLLEDDGRGAEDTKGFSLRLVFARHLSPDARMRLLERRRAQLLERLSRTRNSMSAGNRPLDPYERSLVEHSSETTERDISWLERLIEAERGAGAPVSASGEPNHGNATHSGANHAVAAHSATPTGAGGSNKAISGRNDR